MWTTFWPLSNLFIAQNPGQSPPAGSVEGECNHVVPVEVLCDRYCSAPDAATLLGAPPDHHRLVDSPARDEIRSVLTPHSQSASSQEHRSGDAQSTPTGCSSNTPSLLLR